MVKDSIPVTPAVRFLKQQGVSFAPCPYKYEEKGGTTVAARELGVNEYAVVKTLVMEDEGKRPLIVLMHGDRQVSTRALARFLGVKSIRPCDPAVAQKHTGYQVGGTSPFGTRKPLPVYVEETILDLSLIYINGGKRGFLLAMPPGDLARVLRPTPVQVGYQGTG